MANAKKVAKRKYTTITIPAPLFEKMKESIKGTGFSSVSDYVTFILRETTIRLNNAKKRPKGKKEEKDEVIEKLRALGYI